MTAHHHTCRRRFFLQDAPVDLLSDSDEDNADDEVAVVAAPPPGSNSNSRGRQQQQQHLGAEVAPRDLSPGSRQAQATADLLDREEGLTTATRRGGRRARGGSVGPAEFVDVSGANKATDFTVSEGQPTSGWDQRGGGRAGSGGS